MSRNNRANKNPEKAIVSIHNNGQTVLTFDEQDLEEEDHQNEREIDTNETLVLARMLERVIPSRRLERYSFRICLLSLLLFIITLIFGWFIFSSVARVLISLSILFVIMILTFIITIRSYRKRMKIFSSMTKEEIEFAILEKTHELAIKAKQEDLQMELFHELQEIRKTKLVKMSHIKEYKLARRMHEDIQDEMVSFFEKGGFVHQLDLTATKRYNYEGILYGKAMILDCEIDLETELGMKAFIDIMIYKISPDYKCITEVFIAKRRYRKPDKVKFLQAMLDSTIGLFIILEVDKEMAQVTLEHVFTGQRFKIVDIGFSATIEGIANYLYTRIITYREVSFATGFAMLFKKGDRFVRKFIAKEKDNYLAEAELARLIKLYQHTNSPKNKVKTIISSPF